METDDEIKKILRRLYNLKYSADKLQLKENEKGVTYKNVLIGVFKTENKSWEAFVSDNLPYLDFPLWLAEMVDGGELPPGRTPPMNWILRVASSEPNDGDPWGKTANFRRPGIMIPRDGFLQNFPSAR